MTSIKDALEKIAPAVEQLACHQTQLDQDGVMVGVSRQAIYEVVNAINEIAISITTPAPGRDELRERVARIIDPQAFNVSPPEQKYSEGKVCRRWSALKKADAILSALPVAPVVDEAGIRADEREKCARVAESPVRQEEWPRSVGLERTSPTYLMQQTIAQVIRAGGGER